LIVDTIGMGDPEFVEILLELPAIEAVSSALRHALVAGPGKTFLVGDFAGIEMRIVLALAGQHDKCDLLATGKDVYLDMACDIVGRPRGSLTKDNVTERQIGKTPCWAAASRWAGASSVSGIAPINLRSSRSESSVPTESNGRQWFRNSGMGSATR